MNIPIKFIVQIQWDEVLFTHARISKIMRCFINLFYLAVQSKLVLTLTMSENGLGVLGLSGFIMVS